MIKVKQKENEIINELIKTIDDIDKKINDSIELNLYEKLFLLSLENLLCLYQNKGNFKN